ncbi:hypothetical protein [Sphingomonas sp.]|uniref:hypothetical protein n=1 Tax=Sphingomonas sp. TaxID=28214 RepID=UPI001B13C3BD|nr:hypothetical protein [Sphingomonas sp.]MBO9711817.1 hypothetical protein [Sphingomonas sp.]
MSMLDGLLGQIGEHVDVNNLAAKVGLSPEHVQQAIAQLAHFHTADGDTAEGAAAATGLPLDKIQEIVSHLGGEGALAHFAGMLQGQGGVLGSLGGLLGKS